MKFHQYKALWSPVHQPVAKAANNALLCYCGSLGYHYEVLLLVEKTRRSIKCMIWVLSRPEMHLAKTWNELSFNVMEKKRTIHREKGSWGLGRRKVPWDPLSFSLSTVSSQPEYLRCPRKKWVSILSPSTLLWLGAGQHCLRRFFLGQKTMSWGTTTGLFAITAFWPIPQLGVRRPRTLTWIETASWKCAHHQVLAIFSFSTKILSLQAVGQLKEVRGVLLDMKVGALKGMPIISFLEHVWVPRAPQSILWCI